MKYDCKWKISLHLKCRSRHFPLTFMIINVFVLILLRFLRSFFLLALSFLHSSRSPHPLNVFTQYFLFSNLANPEAQFYLEYGGTRLFRNVLAHVPTKLHHLSEHRNSDCYCRRNLKSNTRMSIVLQFITAFNRQIWCCSQARDLCVHGLPCLNVCLITVYPV
jgi:hypothetical protein